ncbi:peroxisomal 3-keto-acyl-CoA thiolase 2 [Artemisia annua]|uniref:Peroxisomal 3-keto-acyl-CoA thiolase 2 n=1 Tax=Artemisia annua TaxID=35608 RepID=A0A2U1NVD5_ARTAN|nr:peroxisomal 3-keto-acyl-CoA thiolase 2 [Artemisia annua]
MRVGNNPFQSPTDFKTGEQRFGVSRQEQDQAAVEPHRRAAVATSSGKFKDEIVPVYAKQPRRSTNLADLAKLKPVIQKGRLFASVTNDEGELHDGME